MWKGWRHLINNCDAVAGHIVIAPDLLAFPFKRS
jgi:hypothetical protein